MYVKKMKKIIVIISVILLLSIAGGAVMFFGIPVNNKARDGGKGFDFVSRMGAGINIGGSLDAYNKNHRGEYRDSAHYEKSWSNPEINDNLIELIHTAGFSSVRIPITWEMRTGGAPDYIIDTDFLARVGTIIGWIFERDMIAIINMHNDDYYWYIPNNKNEAAVTERYIKMWVQIADYFKDYDERLVFEAFNEPRVIGSLTEWAGGTAFTRAVVNRLNRVFIDTVRGAGGKNPTRFLIIPTHAASLDYNAVKALKVPADDKYLIAAVHSYKPRAFAESNNMEAKYFTNKEKKAIDKVFKLLDKTFISKGIPVVVGEFGAYHKDNEADRAEFAAYMAGKAKEAGVALFWWENGAAFPGWWEESGYHPQPDSWGFIDRETGTIVYQSIADALVAPYLLLRNLNNS